MAKIIVHRPSGFLGFAKRFKIYVDNQKVGALANGSSYEFEIAAGQHEIYCKQDMFSTIEGYQFSINENETKSFNATYQKPVKTLGVMFLWIFLSIILSRSLTSLLNLNEQLWLLFYFIFVILLLFFMKKFKMFKINIAEK